MTEKHTAQSAGTQFVTVVAQNYLAYALALGESVARFHPDAHFSIFLVDDVGRHWKLLIESRGFRAIYPEEIPLPDYRKFVFQYNVTEACTGVKPFVLQMLIERGAENVIYMDPDTLCFRRLDEIFAALGQYNIVLTPHICSPAPDDYYPGERDFLKSGIFNLGFIALRRGRTSTDFLRWWASRLALECVQEPDAGLFVDQKWMDLAPTCFDGVCILRNPAYNIAYWNLHERFLEERAGVFYESQSGIPVAFMHFSGIIPGNLEQITKYVQRNPIGWSQQKKRYTLHERPDLSGPFQKYDQLLAASDTEEFSRIPYGYAAYDNGETISQLERSLYLKSEVWRDADADPFSAQPGSFWNACRKAGVRAGSLPGSRRTAQETAKAYGLPMRFIEFALKCCLRVLGPERYLDFAKYMRHQFLPSNHGFLLPEHAEQLVPKEESEVVDREPEGYVKPSCAPPKI